MWVEQDLQSQHYEIDNELAIPYAECDLHQYGAEIVDDEFCQGADGDNGVLDSNSQREKYGVREHFVAFLEDGFEIKECCNEVAKGEDEEVEADSIVEADAALRYYEDNHKQ